jgi:hypothetical protein
LLWKEEHNIEESSPKRLRRIVRVALPPRLKNQTAVALMAQDERKTEENTTKPKQDTKI